MIRDPLARLLRAGALTAVVDGLFASALALFVFDSTVSRLWQRVASTVLGPSAFDGGSTTVIVGLLMHVCVAFGWSAVFLLLAMRSPGLRLTLASRHGIAKVASVYGPVVWLTMSLVVIPLLVRRPTTIDWRWWIQLFGHFPFVGLPIVASIGRGLPPTGARAA